MLLRYVILSALIILGSGFLFNGKQERRDKKNKDRHRHHNRDPEPTPEPEPQPEPGQENGDAYPDYPEVKVNKTYDYVVVGAGSGGGTVAARLSEMEGVSVLLLEAGYMGPPICDVPNLVYDLANYPEYEWNYHTEPMEHACQGMEGKRSFWSRFKGLGGCSAHNHMVYNRGTPEDYQKWENITGDKSWGWEGVLEHFKKSENMMDSGLRENGFHGTDGPMKVSVNNESWPFRDMFLDAAKQLGYRTEGDYNAGKQEGFFKVQSNVDDQGKRTSTESSYLRKAYHRKNLHIRTGALVSKVNFDGKKRATGVTFEFKNQSMVVNARKEVILSAGAIGSAQILMLSGIGPKKHLEEMGIPLVADLQVGQNLQDHVIGGGLIFTIDFDEAFTKKNVKSSDSVANYSTTGRGPLSIPAGWLVVGFHTTKYQKEGPDCHHCPDIQYQIAPNIGLDKLPQYDNIPTFTVLTILNRPRSIGNITLRSTNIADHPIIRMSYYEDKYDLDVTVAGMQEMLRLMEKPSVKKLNPVFVPEAAPNCQHLTKGSEEFLRCSATQKTFTVYHYSGTARMGKKDDPGAVVDPQLRVRKVKGLRVIDASVIPFIVSANINAPCIMIGEKGADFIKNGQ